MEKTQNKQSLSLKKRKMSAPGFSLMEILVVIGLIGAIAGLVILNLDKIFSSGKEQIAKLYVNETIKTPLFAYKLNVGNYPTTEQGLESLVKQPSNTKNWKGPYIDKLQDDPWGHPYQYKFPGVKNPGGYDVWSLGPDGIESDEDIGNWEEK